MNCQFLQQFDTSQSWTTEVKNSGGQNECMFVYMVTANEHSEDMQLSVCECNAERCSAVNVMHMNIVHRCEEVLLRNQRIRKKGGFSHCFAQSSCPPVPAARENHPRKKHAHTLMFGDLGGS